MTKLYCTDCKHYSRMVCIPFSGYSSPPACWHPTESIDVTGEHFTLAHMRSSVGPCGRDGKLFEVRPPEPPPPQPKPTVWERFWRADRAHE
jgi:hypothetical protein